MHLTHQQIALVVAISLEVQSAFGVCVWAAYYSFSSPSEYQAELAI
jgi:hypothetical protein